MEQQSPVRAVFILLTVLLIINTAPLAFASPQADSWVIRSEIRPNTSVWGPGPSASVNYNDTYGFNTGVFRGGFDWNVHLDHGTIVGNVEGALQASYDNFLSEPGITNISLAYAGLKDESRIGADAIANVSVRPFFGANIFGSWVDGSLPISLVNTDLSTADDFTTGLGTASVHATQDHSLLEVGAEVLLVEASIDIHIAQHTYFTPKLFNGVLNYEHIESGSSGSMILDVWNDTVFATDGSTPLADFLDIPLDLDKPGHWNFTLDEFYLEQSDFRTELDLGVGFGVGVPLFGTGVNIVADVAVANSGNFNPDFELHNLLGDTRVGQFSIFVDSVVPVPASVWLFSTGLIGMVAIGRRGRSRLKLR